MSRFRIAILGDSLTAGYGLHGQDALPTRLRVELERRGIQATVADAGISGDTLADGLRRMERDIPPDVDLCIVALGANDMMQHRPVRELTADLEAILRRLAAKNIAALVCGMRAPPWFGAYAIAFDAVFPETTRRLGVPLHDFLLEGVALNPAYVLPDRIHPNAKGIEIVARNLAETVATCVAQTMQRPCA